MYVMKVIQDTRRVHKINGHLDMCARRLYCILKGSIEIKKNNKNNCSTFSLQGHVVDVIYYCHIQ
jgi:hypothetical protein